MPLLSRRLALILLLVGLSPAQAQQAPPVTVFAAASLKTALEDVARSFTDATGTPVRFSFAASSALARQIEAGAPADVFASADIEWMDYLAGRRLVMAGTRVDLLGNRLVVVAPAASPLHELALTPDALRAALGTGRIATGEVTAVPAGRYAKAALEHLGLWAEAGPRLAQAENVRAALAFVSRGEAPLGIVYETDARADPGVRVVAAFPPGSHPPIVYPFAVTAGATAPEAARRFLAFLGGPQARAAFEAQGFTILTPSRPGN
ncbi:molybdate ABC transporter substrate-binding protein [Salinarimonas soli]|uniref:Molybdate ABC transporter substrate-binding protein n=1 Tax=Salinarimonas soli TaxID=1638099 RepID=A0A5B2VFF7_9HYPH|nr:molybdate ABC transporter substrate-binding protein [Salinarimonas soli]KAA2237190.1 molybdate ABC transporter substrate-binding protein [Salinarimonas soli]